MIVVDHERVDDSRLVDVYAGYFARPRVVTEARLGVFQEQDGFDAQIHCGPNARHSAQLLLVLVQFLHVRIVFDLERILLVLGRSNCMRRSGYDERRGRRSCCQGRGRDRGWIRPTSGQRARFQVPFQDDKSFEPLSTLLPIDLLLKMKRLGRFVMATVGDRSQQTAQVDTRLAIETLELHVGVDADVLERAESIRSVLFEVVQPLAQLMVVADDLVELGQLVRASEQSLKLAGYSQHLRPVGELVVSQIEKVLTVCGIKRGADRVRVPAWQEG